MSRPEFDPNAPVDPIDDIVYRGIRPDDVIDLDSVYKVLPEAGLFSPAFTGVMGKSLQSYPVYIRTVPRGIHIWLCRLRIHAWEDRWRSGHPNTATTLCAVCGVLRG